MSDLNLELPEVKAAITAEAKRIADEEAGGLKSKNTELLDEVKNLKANAKKFEGIDPEEYKTLKESKRNKEDKDSDPVQLRKRIEDELSPKIDAEKQRADAAESKLKQHIIDSELTNGLLEAGVAKEFLPAAKALLQSSRKLDVGDSGAVIDGKPVAEFAKTWAAGDGKPFIAAANNSGGGSKGGQGSGATGGKKASDMNAAEKAAYIREHGSKAYLDKSASGS